MKPKQLDEFIGNERAVAILEQLVKNYQKTKKPIKNILFTGSASSGKTTLAEIIATEIDANFIYINATAIENPKMFRNEFVECDENKYNIIFIDEVHALKKNIFNGMLSLFEYPYILCTAIKGEILKEELPAKNVTFILATTDPQNIPAPLITRCMELKLQDYTTEEYKIMVEKTISLEFEDDAINHLSEIARTPRQLNQWIEMIETTAVADGLAFVSKDEVIRVMDLLGYNKSGLRHCEEKMLKIIDSEKKIAIDSIASFIDITAKEIKTNIEPFLIKKGYLSIVSEGRTLTQEGRNYINETSDTNGVQKITKRL